MGVASLKYEHENISFYPNFIPGISPIKTEPDTTAWGSIVSQIANRLNEVTLAVGVLQQGLTTFTRAAPQAGAADMNGVAESIRQLTQRLDDLEARVAKG